MPYLPPIHIVCPHCKRPVIVQPDQSYAQCSEHGQIVPIRSAIANQPQLPLLNATITAT